MKEITLTPPDTTINLSKIAVDIPQADAQPQPGRSLKQLAFKGSAWTLLGYGISQVLRLGGNLVLTRLLFPEAFGLMALVQVFIQGLIMFSDVGVAPAIVRDERGDDPAFLNTAWAIQVVRGIVLWICACLIAWPMAQLFHEPMLTQLIPVAALTAVLAGFNSTALPLAHRHLRLGRLTMLETLSYAIGLIVMVALAFAYRSVWVLVVGGLLSAAIKAYFSHWIMPEFRNRFQWDWDAWWSLYHFGKWITLSSAIFFLSRQIDRPLLGAYVGTSALGIYSIALMMSEMPIQLNMKLARQVALPAFGKIYREQPQRISEIYYRTRRSLDSLFLPGLGFLIICGEYFIEFLYDPRWVAAGWMLQILSIRAVFYCILEPTEQCLVAMGKPQYAVARHIIRLAWMVVALPVGWAQAGVLGVIVAIALSEIPVAVFLCWGMHKQNVLSLRKEFHSLLWLLAGVLAAAAFRWGVMQG